MHMSYPKKARQCQRKKEQTFSSMLHKVESFVENVKQHSDFATAQTASDVDSEFGILLAPHVELAGLGQLLAILSLDGN